MTFTHNSATTYFPSQLHWTSEQLADAVPLRLHQLYAFDAGGHDIGDSANMHPSPRVTSPGFLPATPAPAVFRIR